ncbi:MAG: fibronectin type III domain-containing protein [Luteolibacter sp.]
MKTQIQRVSFAFNRGSDSAMLNTAYAVSLNLYSAPVFIAPPITQVDLDAGIAALEAAKAAMVQGGTAATQTRDLRKQDLYALLQQLAYYVNVESNNDLATLLSSGFEAVDTSRTSEQLLAPVNVNVKNGLSHQSLTTIKAVKNARSYEMQYAMHNDTGEPEWSASIAFTNSRNMPVDNLIAGKYYIYRVRAVGGSTGYSDWSEIVMHLAY